jgi:hypothetical protein
MGVSDGMEYMIELMLMDIIELMLVLGGADSARWSAYRRELVVIC